MEIVIIGYHLRVRFRHKAEQVKKVRWIDWMVVVIGLLLAVRTGASAVRIWKAGDRLTSAEVELERAREENIKLKGQVALAQSDQFVEREARDKLGLGREGEVILIMPQETATTMIRAGEETVEPEDLRPNWKKWWDLYVRI